MHKAGEVAMAVGVAAVVGLGVAALAGALAGAVFGGDKKEKNRGPWKHSW